MSSESVEERAPGDPTAAGESVTDEEPLSGDALGELKSKAAKADEHWNRLLRVTADFDNFKKRAARERDETRRNATEAVLGRLLPALDNFDMALAAADQPGTSVETLKTGIAMIHGQLRATLSELGLEEVSALGQPFDPSMHDAVSQQETTEAPEGQVVQQLRKGYRLRDRLVRPASVVVAKKPGGKNA